MVDGLIYFVNAKFPAFDNYSVRGCSCSKKIHTELKYWGLKGHHVCNPFSNRKENNLHSYVKYTYLFVCMCVFSLYTYIKRQRYRETKKDREG